MRGVPNLTGACSSINTSTGPSGISAFAAFCIRGAQRQTRGSVWGGGLTRSILPSLDDWTEKVWLNPSEAEVASSCSSFSVSHSMSLSLLIPGRR